MKSKLMLNPKYELYEKNGRAFCDSLQIANELNKRHDHILRDIENKLIDISKSNAPKFGEINFIYDFYKDARGRKQPRYLLTKDGFVFLVSSYGGDKATDFKIAYITRFNQMAEFIRSLQSAKLEFPAFTNAIMESHDEPKHYHFSNEINMINRIVLGMDAKRFKQLNNINADVPSIRPFLQSKQIKAIEELQRIDIGMIVAGLDFKDRKRILTETFSRRYITAA